MSPLVIPNPVTLLFDPETCPDEDWANEGGVRIKTIFSDPIARTLWLGYKSRHLTNQFFRPGVMNCAALIRRNPPRYEGELHVGPMVDSSMGLFSNTVPFRNAIWPHIVWSLQFEGLWRWMILDGTTPCELRYVVDLDPKTTRKCKICASTFSQRKAEPTKAYCGEACAEKAAEIRARERRTDLSRPRSRVIRFEEDGA